MEKVSTAAVSLVDGAVNSFVLEAAQELPRGMRVNVVCPTVVEDSAVMYADYFPGLDPGADGKGRQWLYSKR